MRAKAYYRNLVADEREKAEIARAFYAEYMAVSDARVSLSRLA